MNRTTCTLRQMTAFLFWMVLSFSILCPTASAAWGKNDFGQWTYTEGQALADGFRKIDGSWYYFNQKGIMQTGWQKIENIWYHFSGGGVMKTGWLYDGGSWYLFNGGGAMRTGWQQNGGKWYFFNGGGQMKTGWVQTSTGWYYCVADGAMQTGWLEFADKRYYLDENGRMATGRILIDDAVFVFSEDGALTDGDTSEYASQVIELVNKLRRQEGVSPLVYSSSLSRIAQKRAEEQVTMAALSHKRPDGTDWYTIFPEFQQSSYGTGENLAMNHTTPDAVVKSWMESEKHKRNILNKDFVYMGLGYTVDKNNNIYWAQIFSQAVR